MRIRYISNARIPTEKAHGVQIMSMCEAFAELEHEVELVVPRKYNFLKADPFEYYGAKKNFTIRTVAIPDLGSRSAMLPRIFLGVDVFAFAAKLLFSHIADKGDILYFRDFPLLFVFLPRRYRLIVEVHHIFGWKSFFVRALKRAHLVVAITEALKDDLTGLGLPANRIIVAPDGVDLSLFENVESKEVARKRLGLLSDKKAALYIGRIDAWKGTNTLFEAAKHLSDVQVVVIGDGPQKLSELKERYPRVLFLGSRPYREIADNQAAADVLVLPNSGREQISARHTSPLKLFTYMASKIPIIGADLPSMREVLSEKEAYFFSADDPKDLAIAIRKALSDPGAASRAARAYEKVQQYSWAARARHILEHLLLS